jgi:quinol monooxygenase YgiN
VKETAMLIVIGIIHVEPSAGAEFYSDIRTLAVTTRERDGNLSYDVAMDDASTGRWLVAERWRDQAALTAHLQADDTTAFVERWKSRMSGDIRRYDVSNERGLIENS